MRKICKCVGNNHSEKNGGGYCHPQRSSPRPLQAKWLVSSKSQKYMVYMVRAALLPIDIRNKVKLLQLSLMNKAKTAEQVVLIIGPPSTQAMQPVHSALVVLQLHRWWFWTKTPKKQLWVCIHNTFTMKTTQKFRTNPIQYQSRTGHIISMSNMGQFCV